MSRKGNLTWKMMVKLGASYVMLTLDTGLMYSTLRYVNCCSASALEGYEIVLKLE